jgi:hypothetical protein
MWRFIIAGLVIGFVLNLTGWAGNVFLLGSMWEQAGAVAPPPMHSPFSPLVHAILQFVSDFVFAFVLCAVYRLAIPSWRRSQMILAFICGVIVCVGGVPMCYLGLVNGGYLPVGRFDRHNDPGADNIFYRRAFAAGTFASSHGKR